MEKKPESFQELLNLQVLLDETIDRPRENGFKPRYRTYEDIKMSIIAEVIEFNEENLKEESIDILFFFLQFVNKGIRDNSISILDLRFFINNWDKLFRDKCRISYSYGLELAIIKNVSRDDILRAFTHLIELYKIYGISQDEVYSIYYRKWQKNIERIKKDWTLKGDNNVAN